MGDLDLEAIKAWELAWTPHRVDDTGNVWEWEGSTTGCCIHVNPVAHAYLVQCAQDTEALVAEVERLRGELGQTEHVVVLADTGWAVEHLAECRRIPNGMTKCAVHEALDDLSDELLDEYGYGRFRLVGWDDDYPLLAALHLPGAEQ